MSPEIFFFITGSLSIFSLNSMIGKKETEKNPDVGKIPNHGKISEEKLILGN